MNLALEVVLLLLRESLTVNGVNELSLFVPVSSSLHGVYDFQYLRQRIRKNPKEVW